MILGRILGIFVAVSLMALFPSESPLVRVILILVFTVLGLIISILGSIYFGPNLSTNRPYSQDSEEYWTSKYGEEMGKKAYKLWIDEITK